MVHTTTTNSHGLSSASMTNRSAMVVISSDAQHPGAALRWHPYLRTTLTRLWTNFRGAATGSCQNSPIRQPHFGASAASQIYEPEAAVVADPHRPSRRHQRVRGSPTPQRRHNAITDRQPYPGYFCDLPTATQRGDIGRVYHNPTESVPDRRPARRTPQVPRDRDDWIPIDCPASSPTGCSRPPATFATDNTKWSSRRAVAGQWQRRRLLTRVDPNDTRQQGQLQQGLANVFGRRQFSGRHRDPAGRRPLTTGWTSIATTSRPARWISR